MGTAQFRTAIKKQHQKMQHSRVTHWSLGHTLSETERRWYTSLFLSQTNEKVHRQCSRRGVRENKTRTVRRNYKQKKHRRGTQDLSRTKACTRASKLHTRYFLLLIVVHASFTCGLTVSFASTLSPCPVWSAHCMRVKATGWALPNRLALTAGSFLIRSCRVFSHLSSSKTASLTCCLKTHLAEVLDTTRLAPKMGKSICRIQVSMNFENKHASSGYVLLKPELSCLQVFSPCQTLCETKSLSSLKNHRTSLR